MIEVGSSVRIVRDAYPELVGVLGTVERIGDDGTTAWITTDATADKGFGVWCSISHLEEVK